MMSLTAASNLHSQKQRKRMTLTRRVKKKRAPIVEPEMSDGDDDLGAFADATVGSTWLGGRRGVDLDDTTDDGGVFGSAGVLELMGDMNM